MFQAVSFFFLKSLTVAVVPEKHVAICDGNCEYEAENGSNQFRYDQHLFSRCELCTYWKIEARRSSVAVDGSEYCLESFSNSAQFAKRMRRCIGGQPRWVSCGYGYTEAVGDNGM